MRARKAGVREAKAKLSRMLRDVQSGREWIITDRGRPVARLVPVSAVDLPLEERLKRLEDAGVLEPPNPDARPLPPPILVGGELAQRWLQEDRDSRKWPSR